MGEEKSVVEYKSHDGQELKLSFDSVRKFLVSGKPEFVTDQEIIFFMAVCKSRGLNPFKRDAYLVKYTEKDNAAIITSIDYYRARAKAQPDCQGWRAGIVVRSAGKVDYREGCVIEKMETLVGGWFEAQPKGWDRPRRHAVSLAGYIKRTGDGRLTRFWAEEKQPDMISKVAEAQGLRMVWPDEFEKLYAEEEIAGQATDVTPEAQPKGDSPVEDARQPASGETWKEAAQKVHAETAKGQLETELRNVCANSNQFKDTLKRLTGKTFMQNVTEPEAKAALEQFLDEQKGAA